jgi:hypothetical protein
LRPAHSRGHLYVTCYTEGFSHFVTSMTAPVASGWSGCRVGLSPTGKRRPLTAHTCSGHCGSEQRASQLGGEHRSDRKSRSMQAAGQEWFMRGPGAVVSAFGYARRPSSRRSLRIALLQLYALRCRPSTFKDQPSASIACCIAPRGALNIPLAGAHDIVRVDQIELLDAKFRERRRFRLGSRRSHLRPRLSGRNDFMPVASHADRCPSPKPEPAPVTRIFLLMPSTATKAQSRPISV